MDSRKEEKMKINYYQDVIFKFSFENQKIHFMIQGQEVEFHEIEIQLFQEIDKSIMRSKFLIMS
jgi:hypothetical protein